LFIDHRQLLTFGLIKEVPLINSYEKKVLMDYAMASDEKYFRNFHDDLKNKRFALIINEPSNLIIRETNASFGQENNAFVKYVTKPLLCYYIPIFTSNENSLEILIPRGVDEPINPGCDL
jgi:hypothetical protein